ncbi:MAG TPA: hypothetical protein VK462_05280 [Nitrososphaeraceae archaeon]|nr:hypothetical protein [Nitrososphaeraceae archaeon]
MKIGVTVAIFHSLGRWPDSMIALNRIISGKIKRATSLLYTMGGILSGPDAALQFRPEIASKIVEELKMTVSRVGKLVMISLVQHEQLL